MTPFHLCWYSKSSSCSGLLQGILVGWWWNVERCILCFICLMYVNFKSYRLETFFLKRGLKSNACFEKKFLSAYQKSQFFEHNERKRYNNQTLKQSWRNCCSYEDFRIRHFVTYFNGYKVIPPLSCVWTLRYEKELKPGQFCSGQVVFLIRLPEKLMETTFLLYKPFSLVHCTHNLFLLTLCPHSASANCIPAVKYDVIK